MTVGRDEHDSFGARAEDREFAEDAHPCGGIDVADRHAGELAEAELIQPAPCVQRGGADAGEHELFADDAREGDVSVGIAHVGGVDERDRAAQRAVVRVAVDRHAPGVRPHPTAGDEA
ncbi:hypothetical protein BMW26_00445 [Microbacterium sp. 1.5R]|nr:hypothetical protein BMW26_00445 [Microbacterium sp. 1.5R]